MKHVCGDIMSDVELLTLDEVSCVLRIAKSTLFRLKKQDPSFPSAVKIGHRMLWKKNEIKNYINSKQEAVDK